MSPKRKSTMGGKVGETALFSRELLCFIQQWSTRPVLTKTHQLPSILIPSCSLLETLCKMAKELAWPAKFHETCAKFLFRISRNFRITSAKFCETKFTKISRK